MSQLFAGRPLRILVHSMGLSQVAREDPQAFHRQLARPRGTPFLDRPGKERFDLHQHESSARGRTLGPVNGLSGGWAKTPYLCDQAFFGLSRSTQPSCGLWSGLSVGDGSYLEVCQLFFGRPCRPYQRVIASIPAFLQRGARLDGQPVALDQEDRPAGRGGAPRNGDGVGPAARRVGTDHQSTFRSPPCPSVSMCLSRGRRTSGRAAS